MSRDDLPRFAASEAAFAAAVARLTALVEGSNAPEAPMPVFKGLAGFSLSPFETDIVLLLAGAEVDGALSAAIARRPEAMLGAPTFGLANAVLPGAHWSATAPSGPLRHWRLIEIDSGAPLTTARLRIDERILHHLLGTEHDGTVADQRLAGIIRAGNVMPLAPAQAALAAHLAARLPATGMLALSGDDLPAMAGIAAAIAAARDDQPLLVVDADLIPPVPAEMAAVLQLIEREARLTGALLLITGDDNLPPAVLRLIERLEAPTILASREPARLMRIVQRAEVNKPGPRQRLQLWREALPDLAPVDAARLAATYRIGAVAIAAEATAQADVPEIETACRIAARARLDAVATRVPVTASFDDLVLPEPELQRLRAITAQMRARPVVDLAWPEGARGLGIAVLFAGDSGTGKTMAAEAIASDLGLDLYRVDLSQTVSKYIGETAKNLGTLFDAAEEGGAILLFDEADALFGKRSEVRDAHDRYANIETSYLLQRLENHAGLVILTTNLRHALDPAFQRRLRFVVSFPFPDQQARARIWAGALPGGIATEGLDHDRLGQLAASGGAIRVVAINAAFAAADEGVPVAMRHMAAAAHAEAAKRERPLAETETRKWL